MKKVSKSPERHTFQKNAYIERCKKEGKEPSQAYLKMYEDWNKLEDEWAKQEHKNDLKYDLVTCPWILEKVRNSDSYAQNLYAAMCNMEWQSREFWQEMKGETWSCSWRSAGGIIADMREEGDYIDWYCSGIRGGASYDDDIKDGFVPEGVVTEEIELDLNRLGWRPVPYSDDDELV